MQGMAIVKLVNTWHLCIVLPIFFYKEEGVWFADLGICIH